MLINYCICFSLCINVLHLHLFSRPSGSPQDDLRPFVMELLMPALMEQEKHLEEVATYRINVHVLTLYTC